MSSTNYVVCSFLASLTFAASARAQHTTSGEAPPPQPTSGANVADLTDTTLSSPPALQAPAPVTSATASPAASPVEPAKKPMSAVTQSAAVPQQAAPTTPTEMNAENTVRHGFYLRLNQGMGYVAITGDGPFGRASIKGLGSVSVIALGASIGRGVVLAGTLQSMGESATFKRGPFEGRSIVPSDRPVSASSKADTAFSQIGLLVDWFPNPTAGWHVGASGGVGTIAIINRADDSTLFGYGFTGTLFGGYDWRIAREWSFGLSMVASGITTSTMKYSDDGADAGYRLRGLSLGVSGSILYF